MIRFFRYILIPASLPYGVTPSKAHSRIARALALFLCFVFTMDAINIDVLYAEAQENYSYQDNPGIVDSQFDTTFQATTCTSHSTDLQKETAKFKRHEKLKGAILYEDIDSPTVLDGASTQTLVASFKSYFVKRSIEEPSVYTTFDR